MSSSKKTENDAPVTKTSSILPIDKKQVKDLKSRAKALVDSLAHLSTSLKKATTTTEDFCSLLPPQLEGITHALQSIEEAQHKKRKRAEKDPDAPKKPATSYFLFSNAIRPKVKEEHPEMDQQQLATLMGTKWKALTGEERKVWEDKAALAKEKYAEEDKAYKAAKTLAAGLDADGESDEDESEDEPKASSSKAGGKRMKTEGSSDDDEESDEDASPKKSRKDSKKIDKKSPTKKDDKKASEKKKASKPIVKKADDKKKEEKKKAGKK